jgi:hypothetical protein
LEAIRKIICNHAERRESPGISMEYRKLKLPPPGLAALSGRSDVLVPTTVAPGMDPRGQYLNNPTVVPAPLISSSPFVPPTLIEHLMRKKKNSALGVKFRALSGTDEISNMEGAMHTFVTPLVPAFLHGDYRYIAGHGMVRFPDVEKSGRKVPQAREVIISASIQLDFEGKRVMLKVCGLEDAEFRGRPLPEDFKVLDTQRKQNEHERTEYDTALRAHMVHHLTAAHCLPGVSEVAKRTLERPEAMNYLENQISILETDYKAICDIYVKLPSRAVISVELLFNSAVQQLRNEISALEAFCPQGYVLTIDPPSIFAQEIGATFLNRILFAALKWLAEGGSDFANMKAFAFNDYADRGALGLLLVALEKQGHVQVVRKDSLFPGLSYTYKALEGTEGALLVVHNNSGMYICSLRNPKDAIDTDIGYRWVWAEYRN